MILTALSLALSGEKRVYQSGASAFFFADLERRLRLKDVSGWRSQRSAIFG
jgi:hypothetical protein